ncbi:MAG: glycoside hydrolase family 97 protein [Planctomycetales bacterium]
MRQFSVLLAGLLIAVEVRAASPVVAVSPDDRVRIEVSLRKVGALDAVPCYRVTFDGQEVIGHSRLGVEFSGDTALGGSCEIVAVEARSVRDEFTQVTGKRRGVRVDAAEVTAVLRETNGTKRTWEVHLRAYDAGAAFRYRFLKQNGWETLAVQQERTEFRVPPDARAFALPLNGFTTSYEQRYQPKLAKALPKDWLLGLPLLLEYPGGTWAAITEANVNEYAGLYLAPSGDGLLSTRLSPLPKEPAVAVRHSLPHNSPWRVVLLGDRVGRLVESDIVLALNEPCALHDTSWIKTGKTTFPWWNGFYEEQVRFKPGLNTATAKHYIDFCAAAGIPYHSLDGVGNTAWYGGPIVPYEGAEPTQGVSGLDLPEVLKFAKAKGVRIRLWMNWKAAEAHMEKAFPLYREWGVEGVMLDFMDRDDQEMNRFVRRAVALAADNQLTVTLHGCPKPTGLERTYPNLLSHEGVMNLEYDKWDALGITPDHEVTVPFTRMLAGPLDFHQGSFRTVPPEAFQPRNDAPLVMGTPARTLASYVVYQNHLSMVADYPSAYRGHPGLAILAAIPTTWDDTQVLDAKVGEYIVIARRSGADWYLGAMTDRKGRTLDVPLRFLSTGRFAAEVVSDDDSAKHGMSIARRTVVPSDSITLKLSAGGGGLVRFIAE